MSDELDRRRKVDGLFHKSQNVNDNKSEAQIREELKSVLIDNSKALDLNSLIHFFGFVHTYYLQVSVHIFYFSQN